ncbi:MAG: Trk system potassium transporter TrkA [Phycisphaerales bacterium]|nr:Trk system potassium transporter TrkA [Phycisphaerales bacterium]
MNIVICGAGQVGSHAAEVLAPAGHNITVIDKSPSRIRSVADTLDVRTLRGNCASAEVLREAGCERADLLVAATSSDEINLLTAAVAKGVGVGSTVVRVHHSTYFAQRGLDYQAHLGIDKLICPEYSTAQTIARTLRNPGALAIENFARGKIEMHEVLVSEGAAAIGVALADLGLPRGTRLAAITRDADMFIPESASVVRPGDKVVLVGNTDVFQQARKLFTKERGGKRRIVVMGGPAMGVWLCRALHRREFSIRLFELRRERAEELAEKLDWVTIIQADPADRSVFDEEHLDQADSLVALLDDDEHNILACAWAKSMGVKQAIAVVQRADYLHLLAGVGIDRAFSPRIVAVREIEAFLAKGPLQRIASLAEGIIDVYRVRVSDKSKVIGKALRDVRIAPDWVVTAIERGADVQVPAADNTIEAGDTVLVIGRSGADAKLKKIFISG